MQVAPRRLTLYRLPEPRVVLLSPEPPRFLAVPDRPGPGLAGDSFAETLIAITTWSGVRAYAETRNLWALWHGETAEPPGGSEGGKLDRRV